MNYLIFEGPDGTGKSTYIEFLSQLLPNNTLVLNYDNKDKNTYSFWDNEYVQKLALMADKGDNIIMSRSFLSERLYADIFGREPRISLEEEEKLYNIAKRNFRIIVLLPKTIEALEDRLVKRGDYPHIIENIREIVRRYEVLAKKYKLNVVYV